MADAIRTGRGFLLANIDVGLLTDPKFLKLERLVSDEGERAATILVYLQTVLQSWHDGERRTVEEAEGLWAPTPERIAVLMDIGLIDAAQRIPETAWENYYGPALARSEKRSVAGRKGGIESGKRRHNRSDASPPPKPRSSSAEAPPNLTPADPPSPRGEAGEGGAGQRLVAPARPIHMDHLDEADTDDIEVMLNTLPTADGRRRRLRAGLDARRGPDTNADLRSSAEATFADMGVTWVPPPDGGGHA